MSDAQERAEREPGGEDAPRAGLRADAAGAPPADTASDPSPAPAPAAAAAGGPSGRGTSAEHAARREEDMRLVERTMSGDRAAFEALFVAYRDKVYGVVFGYVRHKDDALDIVQDAFVKAFQRLESFRGRSSFFTWITQIAINLSIDHTRKRKRRKTVGLEDHHLDQPPHGRQGPREPKAGRRLLEQELQGRYEEALEQLSEKHKTVFLLHTVEGMAYKEIAGVLEISIGTVMSRLHYARKRLQGLLADYLR